MSIRLGEGGGGAGGVVQNGSRVVQNGSSGVKWFIVFLFISQEASFRNTPDNTILVLIEWEVSTNDLLTGLLGPY